MLRYTAETYRTYAKRVRQFLLYRVLHVADPPHQLALGAAIGIFVTFTPTIGLQMILCVFLAWLLRANKAVGVPIVWISNPVTFVPIYYPLYLLGAVIIGEPRRGVEWWEHISTPPDDVDGWWANVQHYWQALLDVAVPLWIGCLIVATALSVPTYFITRGAITAYRIRKWGSVVPLAHVRKKQQDPDAAAASDRGTEQASKRHDANGAET